MVVTYVSWACTVIAMVVDNSGRCEPSSGNIAGKKACSALAWKRLVTTCT